MAIFLNILFRALWNNLGTKITISLSSTLISKNLEYYLESQEEHQDLIYCQKV